jgi:hypothetical protein
MKTQGSARKTLNPLLAVAVGAALLWPARPAAQEPQPQGDPNAPAAASQDPAAATPAEPTAAKPARQMPPSSPTPPTKGHFVGDHWTPYDPPAAGSYPQGSEVYTIVPGDTLWDLSAKSLKDPWLWPQIWDVNQYITDSHWIYPGDPLLLPGRPVVVGETPAAPAQPAGTPAASNIELLTPLPAGAGTPSTPVATAPQAEAAPAAPTPAEPEKVEVPEGETPTTLAPAEPELSPAADEVDVYCSNYLVDAYKPSPLNIKEREDGSRTIFADGDVVFLNKGLNANLSPGDEFTIVRREGPVPHPIFVEEVGESIRMVGRLKIIALQEATATAIITQTCDAVVLGMDLVPFKEIPLPLATPQPLRRYGTHMSAKDAGYIVTVTPDKASIGEGDLINIDLGAENGVQPGDVMTVFREWGGAVEFASVHSYIDGQQNRAEERRAKGEDPERDSQDILGQIVILVTQSHTATAKVVNSFREMSLGDRVGRQ